MPNSISIVATSRYLYVSRADGSLVSRHLTVEDAIEAAVNAGSGEYRITYPDRIVKVYGSLPDTTAPTAPTDLAAGDVTAGFVELLWTDVDNATSYTVYRAGAPIGTASIATFTDSTVVPSTAYSYQVQASGPGGTSTLSDALAVTTSANTPPNWLLTSQSLTLGQAFNLDLNTVCLDFDQHSRTYTLVSGAVPGLSLSQATYAGTPTTVGAYPLTFRANDGYSTTDVSVTFTVSDPDITAPTVPGSVSAVAAGTSVTVTWNASTDASGVALYRVYRNGAFLAPASASPYFDTPAAGTYTYSVSAVDASANANESAQGSAAPVVVQLESPDAPINFSAIAASATSLFVSWQANPNGTDPTGYELQRSTNQTTWSTVAQYTSPNTSVTNTGLTTGTTYYYRVRATVGALVSAWTQTSGVPQASTLVTYGGTSYDQVSYATNATNGWRTSEDTVAGWDFSFPAQTAPVRSGVWQFTQNLANWPANVPGNRIYKINASWKELETNENTYTLGATFNLLQSLDTAWGGVQIDLRGAVFQHDTQASSVTAPSWLAGRGIPSYNTGTFQYYDISNAGWYTQFRELLTAIGSYSPAGSGVTVGNHPRLSGFVLHGISSSAGEEAGLGSTPANHVATIQHAITAFGATGSKSLCWVGEGRSWRDVNEPIIVDGGIGSRGGLLERFLRNSFTPYELDTADNGTSLDPLVTRTGQLAEQYYAAGASPGTQGAAQADNFYLTVDETYPIHEDARYYMDQMEEFNDSYQNQPQKGWIFQPDKWGHIYRMCVLRALQMRRNSIAVELKDTTYNNASPVNGAEGFVSPAVLKWMSVQLGRRVYSSTEDASFEANEAFVALCRMRARCYNPLTLSPGFGTNVIHNMERWLTQRERDGTATTPDITVDMGFNPSGDDTLPDGRKAIDVYPTLGTMEVARRGTNIALRLDDRMRFGSNIAVKVTYYDDVVETWTLRYTTASGTADKTHANLTVDNVQPLNRVRTRTFFITNFSNTANVVNFRLLGNGNTKFMFVRVIKV